MKKVNSEINNAMKFARENKNITQQQLADMVGVSKPYINKIEKKVTKKPSLKVLSQISQILEIDYVDLIEEYNYEIEDLLSEQTIIKFFREYEPSEEVNIKFLYSRKEYTSEDIMNDFKNGDISQLDAIYLFINLIEEVNKKLN